MHNHKLTRILKCFKKEDIRSLRDFVISPYFKIPSSAAKLLILLANGHPKFKSSSMERGRIYTNIFGHPNSLDVRKWNNTTSAAMAALKKFLTFQQLQADLSAQELLLLRSYAKLNDPSFFDSHIKKTTNRHPDYFTTNSQQSISELKPFENELFGYHVFMEWHLHSSYQEVVPSGILERGLEALKKHYILYQLFHECVQANRRLFLSETPKDDDHTEERLVDAGLIKHPTYILLTNIIRLLNQKGDDALYEKTYQLLSKNINNIGRTESIILLTSFRNYQNYKKRAGDEKRIHKLFSLHQFGLHHDLFTWNGIMPDGTFINIANTATLSGNFQEAENFIQTNQTLLAKNTKSIAVDTAYAMYYFHLEKYEIAYQYALQENIPNLRYAIFLRPIELRCQLSFYEVQRGSPDQLYDAIEAFRKYLSRAKALNKSHKKQYLDFIYFFRKIVNYTVKKKSSEKYKEQLLGDLKNRKAVFASAWLQQKIKYLP